MITLLLADDHQLFRKGLRQLCEITGGFTVLAETENGAEAVRLARHFQPDVILMDIRMPGLNGVEATRQIVQANPAARIIVLTMYQQDHHVTAALQAGARGYLLKNCTDETLFAAIRATYQGQAWLDPAVTPAVLAQVMQKGTANAHPLTEAEMEILRLVAHGADNQAIADRLHLSAGTVANRLRVVFDKLGVSNRTEAALYALRHGWASLDPED